MIWGGIALLLVLLIPILLGTLAEGPSSSPAEGRATARPESVGPTPTLRPLCTKRREELRGELAALLTRLTGGTELNIADMVFALDDDQNGQQQILIKFQAYKRGTGKYPKGDLYVDVDDLTCEIVGYDIFW